MTRHGIDPKRLVTAISLILASFIFILTGVAQAQTFTVLHSFPAYAGDGSQPFAGILRDSHGNLYGTTVFGGAHNAGTVYEITKKGAEFVLYSFGSQTGDGSNPFGNLIRDSRGNLYGTTYGGGAFGYGTVFQLSPSGTETILYNFAGIPDGAMPRGALLRDSKGNLYGSTSDGGNTLCGLSAGCGTLFEISSTGKETVIYTFCSASGCADGSSPAGALIFDKKFNIYGTTVAGGNGSGVVFQLPTKGKQQDKETVLYSLGYMQVGAYPFGGIVRDAEGNLYGTTNIGPGNDCGGVFELTSTGVPSLLFGFQGFQNGCNPYSTLFLDSNNNLYGTNSAGGSGTSGTVFEMSPDGTITVLRNLSGTDGQTPYAGLIRDSKDNFYGTAEEGGVNGGGTVFTLTP